MKDNRLWTLTVVAGLSILAILAYLVMTPLSSESGTINQVETGLETAVNKFNAIRADPEYDVVTEPDSNT
ncbi:MAG: hypothetical protein ACT4NT_01565 [Nitrososphaerota archaeon]